MTDPSIRVIPSPEAIERLRSQSAAAEELKAKRRDTPAFTKWRRDTEVLIEYLFGPDSRHITDFTDVRYRPGFWVPGMPDHYYETAYRRGLGKAQRLLASLVEEVEESSEDESAESSAALVPPLARVERLCHRFPLVARRIGSRHADRSTLDVQDEYDAQDLLHALLVIDFDDIRREEWVPTYAGAASRTDFLLPDYGIVLEVKKTRRGLGDKEVREQLLIDRAHYEEHPDCRMLLCFVFDPESLMGNPRELEIDLSTSGPGLPTRVIVAPRT